METILNLVWLAVTLVVIWLWHFRWTVSRENPRHTIRAEAVAIICLIALLFPVISLTDDLHPEILAVDAVGGKRNASLLVANAATAHRSNENWRTHLSLAISLKPLLSASYTNTEEIQVVEAHVPITFVASFRGRSPPPLL